MTSRGTGTGVLESLAGPVGALAEEAGRAILEIYRTDFDVEAKGDDSPLTAADEASHRIIAAGLAGLGEDLPLLSEEGSSVPFAERSCWHRFWLVDPLDGTKEFIKRNGEFTVNIALVEGGVPRLGVIHVPVQGRTFYGVAGSGAWIREADGTTRRLRVRPWPEAGPTVVKSRSHPSPDLEAYLRSFTVVEEVAVGSSLKFCVIAEGQADLYPRFGPTMEWDTAAGQAVLETAGGRVEDLEGRPLRYNKPDLRNGFFVASSRSGEC